MQSKHRAGERGQALFLIVFAMAALIGVSALAVDGGLAYADRRQAQNAADSAVLAAALAKIRGEDYFAAGLNAAADNGYTNDGENSIVDVSVPASGPYAGNPEYIQITITSNKNTFFGPVLGRNQLTNVVEAVARAKPAEIDEIMHGYALISLAPNSNCQNDKAFMVHGEASIELWGGGIFVNSDDPACAFMQFGNGSIIFMEPFAFNVVGGASIQKVSLIKLLTGTPLLGLPFAQQPQIFTPVLPNTGASQFSYPAPFVMPKPSCGSQMAEIKSGDESVLTPGNWDDGDFPPNGVTKLQSGVYCINGDLRINANTELEGNGVVLFVEHGSVTINGSATVNLSAPKGGPLAGLLISLPIDNHNRVTLNGNASSTFQGTILAPGSEIQINGNDSSYGFHSQIIGYFIDVSGNSLVVIKYIDEQNYDALVSPEIQLIQ